MHIWSCKELKYLRVLLLNEETMQQEKVGLVQQLQWCARSTSASTSNSHEPKLKTRRTRAGHMRWNSLDGLPPSTGLKPEETERLSDPVMLRHRAAAAVWPSLSHRHLKHTDSIWSAAKGNTQCVASLDCWGKSFITNKNVSQSNLKLTLK